MATIEEAVSGYRTLRERKTEITARHTEELKPIREKMDLIEAWLHKQLNDLKVESFKTAEGTAYTTRTTSVKITDWSTALQSIVEQDLFHMLEKKLSSKQLELFLNEEGHNLPGTELSFNTNVRVRK